MTLPELVTNGALTAEGLAVVTWLASVYKDTLNAKPEEVVDADRRDFYDKVLGGDLSAAAFFTQHGDAAARLSASYQRTIPYNAPAKESTEAGGEGASLIESADDEPLTEALVFASGRLTPAGVQLARKLALIHQSRLPRGISTMVDRYATLVLENHVHSPQGYFSSYPSNARELAEDVAEIEKIISMKLILKDKLVSAAAELSK